MHSSLLKIWINQGAVAQLMESIDQSDSPFPFSMKKGLGSDVLME